MEAFEPKVLLTAVPAAIQPQVEVNSVPPGSVTDVPPTTLPSAGVAAAVGDPTAAVDNVLVGSYGHAGRSLPVNANGYIASLGQVNVSGSVTVSGRKSAQNVSGLLTLTGSEGSVTIQLEASNARTVVGHGPVTVTETVIGATGAGTAVQGESGSGFLALGHSGRPRHGKRGATAAAQGAFWLVVGLNSRAG